MAPEHVLAFVKALQAYSSLRLQGLMTLAVFSPDQGRVRACFGRMRKLRDRLRQEALASCRIEQLSMDMSGDFEIAVEEGATVVCIGLAIFGPRPLPNSYYWPTKRADASTSDNVESNNTPA